MGRVDVSISKRMARAMLVRLTHHCLGPQDLLRVSTWNQDELMRRPMVTYLEGVITLRAWLQAEQACKTTTCY